MATAATSLPDSAPLRLTATERIEVLCDPGTIRTFRTAAASRHLGARARSGDGVVVAAGEVTGRSIVCFAQDASFAGGSLGEAHADSIARALALAADARVPVIGLFESAGARLQEGTAALAGYGRVFRGLVQLAGVVPRISAITGASAGGGAYAPALTDFVVMTRSANMFLTGPGVVRDALGEDVEPRELGGARMHAQTGVCQFLAADDADAIRVAQELLSYLPQHADAKPPRAPPGEPLLQDPSAVVPLDTRKVYDVRDVVRGIVDAGQLCEVAARWARNIVTGFARIDGRPIGIVANQPRYLGGVIDVEASQKARRFVLLCNAFGIPLVVLVDTPGFLPGRSQEHRAVIRHGADLLRAFAGAGVPRLSVVLRQAYGGAYITMNSKDLGADCAFAWSGARIGVMGALHAVRIVHRREIEEACDPARHAAELSERHVADHQLAQAAARDGFVDEVIEPWETRPRLAAALSLLREKGARRRRWELT